MSPTTGRRARPLRWLTVVAVLGVTACTGEPAPPPTVRVDRGTVATTVSASGTLVSITEQRLGFAEGGKLAEVLVKVGDRVEPGQVLARLDDLTVQAELDQAQARLAQEQATLDKLRGGNTVGAAKNTLEQAQKILDATKEQADATNAANRSATERARKELDFDKKALDRAEDQLEADERACRRGGGTPPKTTDPDDKDGEEPVSTGLSGGSSNAACDRVPSSKSAVETAKRTVISSQTTLDAAQERERVDEANGRVSVEQARQSVVSADNDLNTAGNDRPADIRVQEAVVRDAQASVTIAQDGVEDTILRAPVAAVVSAVNGVAGEFVGAASGTTPGAPGSQAGLPAEPQIGDNGGNGGAVPGSGAVVVLNNVNTFQLVVPFEESDAAQVAPGKQVEISVDALPDLRKRGSVLAVSPSGDPSTGVVRYYATIVLTEGDPRLRDGQTALADVMADTRENVLRVPTVAVRRDGGNTVVDVPVPEGRETRQFEAGLAGDEYTEVVSGLPEGQELLLPAAP
jgi:HlyD family secretion protein